MIISQGKPFPTECSLPIAEFDRVVELVTAYEQMPMSVAEAIGDGRGLLFDAIYRAFPADVVFDSEYETHIEIINGDLTIKYVTYNHLGTYCVRHTIVVGRR